MRVQSRPTRNIPELAEVTAQNSTAMTSRLPTDVVGRLDRLAARLGLSRSALVRIELEAAIARLELMLPPELVAPEPEPSTPKAA